MITIKETAKRNYLNGETFVLVLNNNGNEKIVECANINLPVGSEEYGIFNMGLKIVDPSTKHNFWNEKWTVAISLQTGCPIGCKFCSVAEFSKKRLIQNLTFEEMVAQFTYAISKVDFDPKKTSLFRIMLARMGEPSANLENTIKFIRFVKKEIPNANFYVSSTACHDNENDKLIDELIKLEDEFGEFIDMQYSIHSSSDEQRKIIQNDKILSNQEVSDLVNRFYFSRKNRLKKVKLNFALSSSSIFNLEDVVKTFNTEATFIKFSMLSENENADNNGIKALNKKIQTS